MGKASRQRKTRQAQTRIERAVSPPEASPERPAELPWKALAIIFFGALLVRLLYLTTLTSGPFYTSPIIDAFWHQTWAQEIAAGNWQGEGAFFRAPLYPFLLALLYRLFGEGPLAPRILQVLLGALSCVLITDLAWRLTGRRLAAYIAAAIAALYGTLLYFEGELLIVTLITFLDLAALAWLVRLGAGAAASRYVAPGLVLGLSAIARPTILVFLPALLFWVWLHREKNQPRAALRRGLAAAAGLLVPVVLITAYNYAKSGDLVVVASQGGINFFIGNNAAADGKTAVAPGTQREIGEYQDNVWVSSQIIAEQALGRELKASEVSSYWFGQGFRFWRDSPGAAAGLMARKFYYFFHGYEIPNNMDPYFSREWSWVLRLLLSPRWIFLPFGLIAPLALVGLFLWARGIPRRSAAQSRVASLLLLFAGSYGLSVVLFFVNARFRLPTVPVFIIFAALALDQAMDRSFRADPKRRLPALALLAALILLLNAPLFGVTRKIDPAWDYVTTGVSYQLGGDFEHAEDWYERALEIIPGHPQVLGNLGTLHLNMDDLDGAADYFLQAVRNDPAQVEAVVNLSSLYLQQSQPEKAIEVCRSALEIQPGLHAASYNLGRGLFALERYDEAGRAFDSALELDPDNERYLGALAALEIKTGRFEQAVATYRRILERDAENAMAWLSLGISLSQTGETGAAKEALARAHELNPSQVEAPLNLAILYEKEHDFAQAATWYERTLEIQEHPVALLNLGQIHGRVLGDHPRAVELLERASRLAPDNAIIFFNLGAAYRLVGDEQKSREAFRTAARLDPQLAERMRRGVPPGSGR